MEETGRLLAPQPHESSPEGCPGSAQTAGSEPLAGLSGRLLPIGRMLHRNTKGLDLPIAGEPEHRIETASPAHQVALLAADYPGMSPTMHVQVGDEVRRGQLLFEDKKTSGVRYTSPGSGRVTAIHRGERRALQSLVVQLDASESSGRADSVSFSTYTGRHPGSLTRTEVQELLLESGLWTALRGRPFGKVANPDETPRSIFVTAMDSHPHAPPARLALEGQEAAFERGLRAVAKLTEGPVFVCESPASGFPVPSDSQFRREEFRGPHPSGTVGFHIHNLDPVDRNRLVWHLNSQDVVEIGRLFGDGQLHPERIVSLAGSFGQAAPPPQDPIGRLHRGPHPGRADRRRIPHCLGVGPVRSDSLERDLRLSGTLPSTDFRSPGKPLPGVPGMALTRGQPLFHHQHLPVQAAPGQEIPLHHLDQRIPPGPWFPSGCTSAFSPFDILPTFVSEGFAGGRHRERPKSWGAWSWMRKTWPCVRLSAPARSSTVPLLRQVLTTIEKEG